VLYYKYKNSKKNIVRLFLVTTPVDTLLLTLNLNIIYFSRGIVFYWRIVRRGTMVVSFFTIRKG